MYYIYHIPGKKIGCTTNLQRRVTEQQGYNENEYEVLLETDNIEEASNAERKLQKELGYKVDMKPYNKLFKKPMSKKVNVTDQTTTFAISKKDIDGSFLGDLEWETPYGHIKIDSTEKIEWILDNIKTSMFNNNRSFIYNKAMHEAFPFQLLESETNFEHIRDWADKRGLYDKGDVKTQLIKLYEETGELSQSILKDDKDGIIDAIGDCVVVLTNLAKLADTSIEHCINSAFSEISNRTGRMINGTFVKDER